ncbi:TPA: phosphoribosylformylglycinamidine synthase subunit PurL, partial [Candidatus Bathyarchaeota archaeon]|nr:phosphoribosylformylglycinamidine synthase subunit PurL [Candidatus Bathyarchaeota archaeon]
LKADQYIHSAKAGDYCVLAGGRTGLDGIHGVTFASAELTKESEQVSRPAVQVANPIEEEKLKRAIQQISELRLGSAITDIGGGGLSCGVCETAEKYGLGIDVDLDKIPLKAAKMAPWEIWISESQERMLLVVPAENLERVLKIFRDEQTEANEIGRYNGSGVAKLTYKGVNVADIQLKSLFNPPKTTRRAEWRDPKLEEPKFSEPKDLGAVLLKLLAGYNTASKEKVVRRYDQEVKGQTVVKPMQGWNAGPSDGAVVKPLVDSMVGVSISSGINPRYGKISPYWMSASVIDEAIRNNVAVGGRRIALLDNFTWGSPEYKDRIGSLVEACKACHDFGIAYGTPFISGKDSLYNESPLGPIVPTLLITALGIVPSVDGIVTMDLKAAGNPLYIVGETAPELGGSEYYHMLGHLGASVPKLDASKTSTAYRRLTAAMDAGYVRACHDLSEGGLAVSLAEMAFTGGLGLDVDIAKVPVTGDMRDDLLLFSESNGRLLVEVSKGDEKAFETLMKGSTVACIGSVVKEPRINVAKKGKTVLELGNDETIRAWKTPLEARR